MRRVLIQKVVRDENRTVVGLEQGHEGWEQVKPMPGEPYCIFDDTGRLLRTSMVVNVTIGFFETQNSYYKLTVLEIEPFDLGGEEPPQKTQEILLPTLALDQAS
jgi:hypothetical protein